jgi:hypothetical protein
MQKLYLTGNTLILHYNRQPVIALLESNLCLLSEIYGTHRYTLCSECRVCTSQETHFVSNKKPNRLILFGEILAVYFEKLTEQTDILCAQNVEFVHHRKQYVSATNTNRLMLFGERVTVYFENHKEHGDKICGHNVEFVHHR